MHLAVTGSSGRLGRALVAELASLGSVRAWSRPGYDLDDRDGATRVAAEHPDIVVHSAAWTDVDACARQPDLATRRNARAVEELATASAAAGSRFVLVSTNEVFSGEQPGRPYEPEDRVGPLNPYGASKLQGEQAAQVAYASRPDALLIVRTAWLYGPPGNDFPTKIVAAAVRARESGEPLRLVRDEVGSPSLTTDVARGIRELVLAGASGVRHVVNAGQASRADWAHLILAVAGINVRTELVAASSWQRASIAPTWGVLASDIQLRPWDLATREYVPLSLLAPAAV